MQDYYCIVADTLRDLRQQAGLSKAKMAGRMNVDERTYARYESGDSAPSLPDFLAMLDQIDAPVFATILRHLFRDYIRDGTTDGVRAALAEYVTNSTSDRDVRQLEYILAGKHGSSPAAQLQLFCALDHLPMDSRLIVAKLCISLWEIEHARGNLINPDDVQPDIELLRLSIDRAHSAVADGRNSYVLVPKK